jgi:formylglycine-generating enzyme required for sulfatase activity
MTSSQGENDERPVTADGGAPAERGCCVPKAPAAERGCGSTVGAPHSASEGLDTTPVFVASDDAVRACRVSHDPATATGAEPAHAWCEVPAGRFTMGEDGPDAVPGDGEGPRRDVVLNGFAIGATTVTNREFAAFVRVTQHVTDAERLGSSFVFYLQLQPADRQAAGRVVAGLPWWLPVEHASWQRPEGPGSHVRERLDHPVVHVSWADAMAYCAWAGTRLPSEAEWEKAARGGLEGKRFAWGDDLFDAAGVPRCNVFRGQFPNAPLEGWQPGPVAAASGEPNGFGLFNVCGNVWEWCADRRDDGQFALRGGSFLCHDSYCNRYRVAARSANAADTSTSNIGFRVVRAAH